MVYGYQGRCLSAYAHTQHVQAPWCAVTRRQKLQVGVGVRPPLGALALALALALVLAGGAAALAEGAATQNIHHKKERAQLDRLKRYGTLYFYEVHCT